MAASDPLVSVVLPTYNREATVGAAIESVLRQTYRELELIVVDDGSSDSTEQFVRGLGDARISYLRHANNRGGSAARNTGLAAARGTLLAFQDSDDSWLPHKLERQVGFLAEADEATAAVYCPYRRRYPDGRVESHPADPARAPRGAILRDLLRANMIGTPTVVARRSCYETVGGFDEALPRFQDWDWMIRVAQSYSVGLIEEPLVEAGFAGDNISGGHTAELVAAERHLLDKHADLLREAGNDLWAYRLWHLAHVMVMQGAVDEGRRTFRRALDADYRPSWACMSLLARVPSLYRAAYRLTRGRSSPAQQD